MNKICCKRPQDSFMLPSSKFFTVKSRKLSYGPDTDDLKPQIQMRVGLSVKKAEKHDKDNSKAYHLTVWLISGRWDSSGNLVYGDEIVLRIWRWDYSF